MQQLLKVSGLLLFRWKIPFLVLLVVLGTVSWQKKMSVSHEFCEASVGEALALIQAGQMTESLISELESGGCVSHDTEIVAEWYHQLGIHYYNGDAYEKSVVAFQKAVKIKKAIGAESAALIRSMNGMTHAALLNFDYTTARRGIADQLLLLPTAPSESRADLYYAEAQMAFDLNDFPVCLEKLQLASEEYQRVHMEYDNYAHVINLQGIVYDLVDRRSVSKQAYLEALRVYTRLQNKPDIAKVFHNLGMLYSYENPDSAYGYFKNALMINSQLQDTLEMARTWHEIGKLQSERGNVAEALDALALSRNWRAACLPKWHPDLIETVALQIRISAQYKLSAALITEADSLVATAAMSPLTLAYATALEARAFVGKNKKVLSPAAIDSVVTDYLTLDSLMMVTRRNFKFDASRKQYALFFKKIYEEAIEFTGQILENSNNKDVLNIHLILSQHAKNASLNDQWAYRNRLLEVQIPQGLILAEQVLGARIAQSVQKLQQPALDSAQSVFIRHELDLNYHRLDSVRLLINNRFNRSGLSQVYDEESSQMLSLIRKSLPQQDVFLNLATARGKTYVTALTSAKEVFWVIQSDSAWWQQVKQHIMNRQSLSPDLQKDRHDSPNAGYKLYEDLLKPADLLIRSDGSSTVHISPDGLLASVPYDALLTLREQPQSYFLYKAAVNLLFNTDGLTAKETNGRKLWPESRHGVMSLNYTDSSFSKAELPRLQNAFVEADAIGKILSCRPVKETGADSAKFYQMLEKSNIVHLIAHARIDNQDPLSAHIVLAGTDKQPHMLTSGQIYTMHNNASFVYLSACNTAQGILEGSEGMQSLARAFLYSGTHSLVMTLWSIPDLSAPAIAQNFYAMLKKGYSKPQAMRLAKLKYLEASPTNIGLQPVFWSAPVTIGSPAPLFVSSFFKGLAVFLLVPVLALTIWATNNFLHNKKK